MFFSSIKYADGSEAAQAELENYFVDYCRGERDILFVTFENANPPKVRPDGRRFPWSHPFLRKEGFPIVGVKPKRADWYRKADVHAFFRSTAFAEFAGRFRRVILYGSSMGGYAAMAFAEACPGCDVIAHNPQSTLCATLAPWENRFPDGAAENWSGDFADAALGARTARRVFLSYDPFDRLDRLHAERLHPANLVSLKVPLVGHSMPSWLLQMGVLKEVVLRVIDGTLDQAACNRLARKRRAIARYYFSMARRSRRAEVALACLDMAEKIGPNDENAFRARIEALKSHALWGRAEEALRRALASAPDAPYANAQMAEVLARSGRAEDALPFARRAAGASPANAANLVRFAEMLTGLKRWDEARTTALQAVSSDADFAQARRVLSRILWEMGDRGAALQAACKAVELDPRNTPGLYTYASFLARIESWQEAAALQQEVIRIDPLHAYAHAQLGACMLRLGRIEHAEGAVRAALRIKPDEKLFHAAWREIADAKGRQATNHGPLPPA